MVTLKNIGKRLGQKATDAWHGLTSDVFAVTGLKIVLLYLIMGVITVALAGYFLYSNIMHVISNSIAAIGQIISSGTPITKTTAQKIILTAIATEFHAVNLVIVAIILALIIITAYILAGVMLTPIRKTAERQKQLIANVAHELRTPLSVMKTNTEVIFAGDASPTREELLSGLTSSLEEIDRMTNIVKFFLNFWLGKDWEKKIEMSKVDVADVADKTVKFMGGIAKDKEVALTFQNDIGHAFIIGNIVTLEEMIVNLLKNAIAYTPAGGSIKVTVRHAGPKEILLSVEDTGIGIAKKDLPKIFDPFYRGDNAFSQRTRRRGSGIGLSIVKEITNLHNARILVSSELGKGTAIAIRFPINERLLPSIQK